MTDEIALDETLLNRFDYDDVFVLSNRFCVQAAIGNRFIRVCKWRQMRGFLDIATRFADRDALQNPRSRRMQGIQPVHRAILGLDLAQMRRKSREINSEHDVKMTSAGSAREAEESLLRMPSIQAD